jgi:anti-sigma-K factor RskA
MTDHTPDAPDPVLDLLSGGATAGLSAPELADLRALFGPGADAEIAEWEGAAAAVALAATAAPLAPLPPGLRARLEATIPAPAEPRTAAPKARGPRLAWVGWPLAAALLVALGVREFRPAVPPAPAAALRDALAARDPAALVLEGTAPAGESAAGSVVWSHARQEGYLTLRNLPDLGDKQLQLWIFDAERDQRYPVDGGAFDAARGEVVIPIRAAVPVTRATLFALTVEPRGGVVVSNRERIVWLAKPG